MNALRRKADAEPICPLTLPELKEIIHSLGGEAIVRADGRPVVRLPRGRITPALLDAIGLFREELLADLQTGRQEYGNQLQERVSK